MRTFTPATSGNAKWGNHIRIMVVPIFFIMSNTTKIHKTYHGENFSSISYDLIISNDLEMTEKALLIFIISMPEDHILSKDYLYESLPDSKCIIDKAFSALIEKGYVKPKKIKDNKGQFKGFNYEIFNTLSSKYNYFD